MTEKRLKDVDIYNLTKSILGCLNGLVFDDGSQVINLLSSKSVNPAAAQNGIMIGVRKVNDDSFNRWFSGIYLAGFEYSE